MMTETTLLQVGNPQLREISMPVELHLLGSEELIRFSNQLLELMQQYKGVGLAAPQIGLQKKILALGFEKSERRPLEKPIPRAVLINPTFTVLSNNLEEDYEACLSVGGNLMAKVPRFTHIYYQAYDPHGNTIEGEAKGLHARIIQHEIDHFDGILFLDRVQDTRTYGFVEEIKKAKPA